MRNRHWVETIASPTPGVTATKSATGQLNTSTLGGHTYTVLATSADGFTGQAQVPYIVRGAPSISITSPHSNQTFTSGKQVHVHYRCRDGALGPGLKSCKAKLHRQTVNGAGTVTPATLTVTAISKDGLTTSKTIAWSITPHVISAPSYYLEEEQNVWGFSEFVAIHNGTSGGNSGCKKIGKVRLCQGGPVSVTLRGPYDAQAKFLQAWHLEGKVPDKQATITAFTRSKAWPTKIAVAGLKAGNTNIATVTVTFTAQALTRGP